MRHRVASHTGLGRRDTWYFEEYNAADGVGTEFPVYVRFVASAKEIDQRLNANGMRALVESDRVMVWRAGLAAPVPPSQLR